MKRLVIEFEDVDEEGMVVIAQRVRNFVLDQIFSAVSSGAYNVKMIQGAREWVYWENKDGS